MREITTHKVNGLDEALTITVLDEPGSGNACHLYKIHGPRQNDEGGHDYPEPCCISFQNGPIKEVGVNGISNESLLAIVLDRLEGFQGGVFACLDNQDAIECLKWALNSLSRRTRRRVDRGVEGTTQP